MRIAHSSLLLALAALAATVPAQTRVSLRPKEAPTSPLERNLRMLAMADKQAEAMRALFAEGAPAVPLLAAEVERGGPGALPALLVLERLGGEAEAAVPVLQRVLAKTPPPQQPRLRQALARLLGPSCILVSRYSDNEVLEVDFAGEVKRRTPCQSPWGAWPMPDDHVGAISYSSGTLRELAWAGNEVASDKVVDMLTCCFPLDDGDRIVTSWNGTGQLARLDAKGGKRWQQEVNALRMTMGFDEVLVLTREKPSLLTFSLAGELRGTVGLPYLCHGLQLLPSGNVLLGSATGKLLEIDRSGTTIAEQPVEAEVNDLFRLRDGRTVVAGKDGLQLLGADGKPVWQHKEFGYCGPLFVRARR